MSVSGSVWRDRPSAVVADAVPDRVQDLVIGAGVTGLVTGLLLARAGRRVAVLDAGDVGAGTTGSSSAKVSLLQGTRLSSVARRHTGEVAAAYLEANREGQAWLMRFCETHGVPMQTRRAVTFAASAESVPDLEREFEVERRLGLGSTWSTPEDVPFDVHAAIVLPDQAQVDPMALADALATQIQEHGGVVCTHQRVVDVDLSGGPVRVRLADGREVVGPHVVLATGSPILDRGFHFATLQAQRSYVIALSGAKPPDGMFLSVGQPVVSVRDEPERALVLVGGHGHVTGRTSSPQRHLDRLRSWATATFPESTEEFAWGAQDYQPFDAVPDVGGLPWSGGRVHVATGYGKWGMTNAVAAALTISADTLGERPEWAEHMRGPAKGRAVIDLASFNVGVAARMVNSLPARVVGARPVCTHLGGVLCWNDAERTWDCPLHGSRFSEAGEVLEGPAVSALKLDAPSVGT
jgi:glycine/D-amino acid oxidase-like deaminating enzyme/nitrite reductase/ring-hydroxylating ferredoxin subunit